MIIREMKVDVDEYDKKYALDINGNKEIFKDAIFFDLEHYVYRVPICIGVFGCCYYDYDKNEINVTQYMLENKKEIMDVLNKAREYFCKMHNEYNKKYIVTFSGNNDFTVINYLFNKNNIDYKIDDFYEKVDLQREYEKITGKNIGLKNLEKKFGVDREETNIISGSNLAKTFCKVMKDSDYMNRMPKEKKDRILLYNQQDVVSLFKIYVDWNAVVKKEIDEVEKKSEVQNKISD